MNKRPSIGCIFILVHISIFIWFCAWVIRPMWYSEADFSLTYEHEVIEKKEWNKKLNENYKKYIEKLQRLQQD